MTAPPYSRGVPSSPYRRIALWGAMMTAIAHTTPGLSASRTADGAAAVVETVAGPGFCPTRARLDPSSTQVGSLAVDSDGTLFFDAGRPDEGVIARVAPDSTSLKLVSGPRHDRSGTRPKIAGRIASSGSGGVLVAQGTRIVALDSGSGLTTISGDPARPERASRGRSSGDGGPANQARFTFVHSIATDGGNNLYLADGGGSGSSQRETFRIRFINRSREPVAFYSGTDAEVTVAPGGIDTIAGRTNEPGALGRLPQPAGALSVMAAAPGRLYLGLSKQPGRSENRRSQLSVLNLGGETLSIHGLAVAPGGIETVRTARSRTSGPALDPADAPVPGYVPGIGADAGGNLFVADQSNHRVLRIDAEGRITTVAGRGRPGDSGDFGPAQRAMLDRPFDVKAGPAGRLYISDAGNRRVRVVDAAGDIRPAPGNGVANVWKCAVMVRQGDAAGSSARRVLPLPDAGGPAGVASDSRGNIYFSLAFGHQVKKLEPSGRITTVAGAPGPDGSCPPGRVCPGFGGDGGPAEAARLASPTALAMNPAGNLYLLDSGNARVRFVNLGSEPVRVHGVRVLPGAIQTVAGNGKVGLAGDGGPARDAQIGTLSAGAFFAVQNFLKLPLTTDFAPDLSLGGLAVDTSGNLYIADSGYAGLAYASFVKLDESNHRVRKVDPAGVISTFAGQGAPPGRDSCCTDPAGLAVDSSGNLYVSDRGAAPEGTLPSAGLAANTDPTRRPQIWFVNGGLQRVSVFGQTVEPGAVAAVAGDGRFGFGGDGGPASRAQLLNPSGIAVRSNGEVIFAEYGTSETGDVRRIAPDGTIDRIAGNGQSGFNGDALRGVLTSLHFPVALGLDACGDPLVADLGNDRLRRVALGGNCVAPRREGNRAIVGSASPAPPWLSVGAAVLVVTLGLLALRLRRAGRAE